MAVARIPRFPEWKLETVTQMQLDCCSAGSVRGFLGQHPQRLFDFRHPALDPVRQPIDVNPVD